MVSIWPFNVFKEIVKEDKIIEYLQFYVLLIGSIWCFKRTYFLSKTQMKLLSLFFSISAIGLLVVAGDEISWGQRILNIEVHEDIKQLNRQEELTVHNLYSVEWLVIYGYVTLSTAGSFLWLVPYSLSFTRKITNYLPSHLLFFYFLFPFIFFTAQLLNDWGIWQSWSEVAELYLYSGIILWLVLIKNDSYLTKK